MAEGVIKSHIYGHQQLVCPKIRNQLKASLHTTSELKTIYEVQLSLDRDKDLTTYLMVRILCEKALTVFCYYRFGGAQRPRVDSPGRVKGKVQICICLILMFTIEINLVYPTKRRIERLRLKSRRKSLVLQQLPKGLIV